MNAEQLAEARGWIADCEWGDGIDASELSDAAVQHGIARHYEGGTAQFITDVS